LPSQVKFIKEIGGRMRFILCAISFFVLPSLIYGGDLENSVEVTVYSGASFAKDTFERSDPCEPIFGPGCIPATIEQRNRIGNSVLFGVGVGYYINRNFEVEGNFSIAPGHQLRLMNNVPDGLFRVEERNVITYTYDFDLVYNMEWKGIRPYITAGIGGTTRDSGFFYTDFAYNFGAGTKFYFKDIGLRIEVNDHIIPDYFQFDIRRHVVRIQSGVFFRLF
jgi:hypothetical protein